MGNLGIESALISLDKKEIKTYLNEAWTLEFIRGVITSVLIYFSADTISEFIGKDVASLIRLISITPIILSVKNIRIAELRKNLDFKPLFFLELSQVLIYIIFSYIFILKSASTISIIYGYIIGCIFYSFFSYFTINFFPKFKLNRNKVSRLFNFSKWYLLGTQINVLLENSLQIISGRVSSLTTLGNFERSDFISRKSSIQLTEIFWKFALPALSNESNPKNLFINLHNILTLLVFFFSYFILRFGQDLINLLSESFDLNKFLFQLFLISIISSYSAIASILFVSKGKTSFLFLISVMKFFSIGSLIFLFFNELTIKLLLNIYLFSYSIIVPLIFYLLKKILDISIFEFFKPILLTYISFVILEIASEYLGVFPFILMISICFIASLISVFPHSYKLIRDLI